MRLDIAKLRPWISGLFPGSAAMQGGQVCFTFSLEHPMAACRKPVRSGASPSVLNIQWRLAAMHGGRACPTVAGHQKNTARFSGRKDLSQAQPASEVLG